MPNPKNNVKKREKNDFNISLERGKLYLHSRGNNSIELKIDVTQVWNFAKELLLNK